MCNLYRMTKGTDEVAKWFDAVEAQGGANFGEEIYPGYPGLVVAGGELKQMTWGFPLVMKGKSGQPLKPKPVNNCRTDKLGSFFWRHSFEERRCLIPLTGWAEAQGQKGAMTRTWLSQPDTELFACAGVWRVSDEFGLCYSMVMTDSAGSAAQDVHRRMPVLLKPEDYKGWVSGTPDKARSFCMPWAGELTINRTDQPWVKGKAIQKSLL
ncbi:SOS response-associated peptidase [Erythrobacter crassostreae]|uniref:Abasic site processing protein n=1 Tax=Erythrobacter crassostreae TaxID=2828328 RepID=A0A9X1F423_9SPHN|nr:SOS response-associated peptidase family protein [Erythrobacter crassostrea]MBV7259581.1 SOS response-associated peptidase family protein [Erythrobacter crassostrea]